MIAVERHTLRKGGILETIGERNSKVFDEFEIFYTRNMGGNWSRETRPRLPGHGLQKLRDLPRVSSGE